MSDLQGRRIALLEGRMHGELAVLVRRHGGEPYSVPALREVPKSGGEEVERLLTRLDCGVLQIVICLTGVGVMALGREAERLDRLPALLRRLKAVTTVCRGPKPVAALKRLGIVASVQTRAPHTRTELLAALEDVELAGQGVALMHYGERDVALATALQERGAQLDELCLYTWELPEELGPLRQLVRDLVAGDVDAVAFTSKAQVRHLWQVAGDMHLAQELPRALNTRVVVAAVGPTCAAELEARGVAPHVVPLHPKMGPMVLALAAYFAAGVG
jgi:uroporphyrinogen-III synthase